MSSRLNFFFSEAIRSLTTNIATSVAATLSMLVALLLVGVFLLFLVFIRNEAQTVQKDAGRVKVFLQETATEDDVNALMEQMRGMPEVNADKVTYVGKEEALAEAKQLFKNNKEVIDNLPANPFPASVRAELRDPEKVRAVASRMEGQTGVDSVQYGGETTEKIIKGARYISLVMLVLATFLVGAATMLVSNTIRLSIFARRREIEVMKLVGASNMFVRLPFMIEGFLCGLVAAVGAIGLIKLTGAVFADTLSRLSFGSASAGAIPEMTIFLGMLGMGIVLGGFGSGLTIRRYLKV